MGPENLNWAAEAETLYKAIFGTGNRLIMVWDRNFYLIWIYSWNWIEIFILLGMLWFFMCISFFSCLFLTNSALEQARPKWAQCAVCAFLSTKLSRHFESSINKLIRMYERNLVAFDFLCCLNNFVLYFGRAWSKG